jgi:hypothetical protein
LASIFDTLLSSQGSDTHQPRLPVMGSSARVTGSVYTLFRPAATAVLLQCLLSSWASGSGPATRACASVSVPPS